jgi:pyruvate/2-oxoglutarate dehydrogenase complex dihydrolipoamide acyltransferase (E2) component
VAEFRMPSLGADMDAGTVVEWRVAPGDAVHRGDIVAVIDTDKADIDVEIFDTGVIDELLVPVGARVPVGTPLAIVRTGAPSSAPPPSTPTAAPAPAPAVPSIVDGAVPAAEAERDDTVRRRLARHLGVELEDVTGTGPGGSVTREDVERAALPATQEAPTVTTPATPPEAPSGETTSGDRSVTMRRAIAKLMARSNREVPHYYVAIDIDLSAALRWLESTNEQRPVASRLLPAALLLKATALAARAVPALNGFWVDDGFVPGPGVHLGVAVSLRTGGLVAPALHDADTMDLDALMDALRELTQRARSGRLRSSEMADPTITVTNLGDQGVETVFGVIYPPQVALVGLGKVVERPWAVDDLIGVRPIVRATLAGDHRATDGRTGARFLSDLEAQLQHPEEL